MALKTESVKENHREAIVKTMAFFDIFAFPPTELEIYEHLDRAISFSCLASELAELLSAGIVREKSGYFYFPGREQIIETRTRRYNYALRKIKRARLISRLFRLLPWIRMIAVANIIGANNLKNAGDIDFFIITRERRIWLSRFFCVLLIKFLGLRPRISNTKDKICLSFFIVDTNKNLAKYMLKEGEDLYFQYWLAGLFPLYDAGGEYSALIKENAWLKEKMPQFTPFRPAKKWRIKNIYSSFYYDLIDLFLGGLEANAKKLQQRILPLEIKEAMNSGGGVIVDDKILKLHVNDRRREFQEKFAKNLRDSIKNIKAKL